MIKLRFVERTEMRARDRDFLPDCPRQIIQGHRGRRARDRARRENGVCREGGKQGVDGPLLYAANVAADRHKPRPVLCFVLVTSTWVPNTSIV